MSSKRTWSCVTALDDRLFVMGGSDENGTKKCSETYERPDFYKFLVLAEKLQKCVGNATRANKEDDEGVKMLWKRLAALPWNIVVHVVRFMKRPTWSPWESIPDMTTHRSGACAAALDGKVIVMRGHDGYVAFSLCGMYDTVQRQWFAISNMTTERCGACAVTLDGKVIVMGGTTEGPSSSSCEEYDTVQRQWFAISNMTTERVGACSAMLDGKVIVMRGTTHGVCDGG